MEQGKRANYHFGEENKLSKAVITGQQIGLLGGPLYTTYKVLGAVRCARQIGGEALYWLETNDADFNEINHIDFLDSEGKLQTLAWDIDSRGYSCGLIAVDDALITLLGTFFSSLRQTEFTPALKKMALGCYAPGLTLAEASRRLAAELYGAYHIKIFSPQEKKFRDFSRSILLREAENTPDGAQCNLFCMIGKRREALFKRGRGFQLRDGAAVDLSQYELVPNVKTRNVCQDAYFHTHTYIAGPGEMKYIAELDPVYRFHGVEKAAVKPRMSLTLLEPKVVRLLKKNGIALDDVLTLDKGSLTKKVLKEKSGFDFKETLEQAVDLTGQYVGKLAGLGLETTAIERFLHEEVRKACGQKRTREKEKQNTLLESLQYLGDALKPYGKKQERVFNIFYYMNLFGGLEFINRLYKNYDFDIDKLDIL